MNTYRPFTAVFGRQENDFVIFTRLDAEVCIVNLNGLTWQFLCKCNGQRTLKEITDLFSEDKRELIEKVFVTLKNEKIIFDSREVFNFFHDWSSIPMSTSSDLTDNEILQLCKEKVVLPEPVSVVVLPRISDLNLFQERQSTRDFTGESLSLLELSSLLFAMYSKIGTGAVPSAGGLYSSIIYSVVLKDGDGIKKGVYVYDHHAHRLLEVSCVASVEKMISLFGSRSIEKAGAIFFLTADVARISNKYSNRGYRFALLEAGHIAQNAYLAVVGTRVGLCEYGGFLDGEVVRYLGLDDKKVLPLISIVVGVKSSNVSGEDFYDELFRTLQSEVSESRSIVDSVSYNLRESFDYKMSVYVAETVKGKGRNKDFCLGSGLTPNEAMSKALAESYERFVSSQTRVDVEGDVPSNKDVLNLWSVCPQHASYLKDFGIVQGKEKVKFWTKGFRFLGGEVYIPTDQVFFPVKWKEGDSSMYLANSTGVAAHQSEKDAIESALLELVERDAIGVHWYSKKTPDRIDPTGESDWIKYRVEEIKKLNRKVIFAKLTLDLTPVVMCFIVGDTYPYCVTGSSSARLHMSACEKSLTEAEITLVSFLNKRKVIIKKEKVWSVEDHAKFLAGCEHNHFNWLLNGKLTSVSSADNSCLSVEQSLEKLNPAIIRLNDYPNVILPVVRIMSEKLLPITFGVGSEHYGHPRLNNVGLKWGEYPAFPHPLA